MHPQATAKTGDCPIAVRTPPSDQDAAITGLLIMIQYIHASASGAVNGAPMLSLALQVLLQVMMASLLFERVMD